MNEKILKIKEALKENKNSLNKSDLESITKDIITFEGIIKDTIKKAEDENLFFLNTITFLDTAQDKHKDRPYVEEIHKKLEKGTINELAKKNIEYEKLFISYNDKLIDLYNKFNQKYIFNTYLFNIFSISLKFVLILVNIPPNLDSSVCNFSSSSNFFKTFKQLSNCPKLYLFYLHHHIRFSLLFLLLLYSP